MPVFPMLSEFVFTFRSRRFVRPEDFEKVLMELSELSEGENEEDESDDPDMEDEMIQADNHSSDSEQSADEADADQLTVPEVAEDDYHFYIGKDGDTLWMSNPLSSTKQKAKNIMKIMPGPKMNATTAQKEVDTFHLFITDAMIDDIVTHTNRYIQKKRNDVNYGRDRDCRETTKVEVKALFGALYLIGIKKGSHTNCAELWNSDGTGMIILRGLFSYKRFRFLLRALRFDNLDTRNERRAMDKLAPIRDFHQNFVNNCLTHYNASEFVTIDEMLHAFRGRCGFIQYIPNKPAKYGLKIYALCDAKTFYTLNLEIYCGKQMPGPYLKSNKPDDIVKRLVEPIKGSKRNITTDNYYTSYTLAKDLLEKGLTLLGTMKKNKREIPPEFQANKTREIKSTLSGFQYDFCLSSSAPKKNKAVIFLSSMHDTNEIDEATSKSTINLDYNATKGGVDTVDQMCASYTTSRISRRWPLALFYRHLDIAGINANIIFKYNNPDNRERRRLFLKNLALSLMETHLEERSRLRNLPKDITAFLAKYKKEEEVQEAPKPGICHICGRHKNNRSKIVCQRCRNNVCKRHSRQETTCVRCDGDQGQDMDVDA